MKLSPLWTRSYLASLSFLWILLTLSEENAHFPETGCICAAPDSSLVVGGRLYVQYSTSEFYFWQRVNTGVFWDVLCCSWMPQNRMIIMKVPHRQVNGSVSLPKPSRWHPLAWFEVQMPGANFVVGAWACCFTLIIQQLLTPPADDVCLRN